MANSDSKRGLGSADKKTREDVARMGGQSQGQDTNPANFANDRRKARDAGKEGGANSHRGR